jgi:hypothetical protein
MKTEPIQSLATADEACRLARKARILWSAMQERMVASGADDAALRSFARSALSFAHDSVRKALREENVAQERAEELSREAEYLRVDLRSAELPYENSAALRSVPQGTPQSSSPAGSGEAVDLGEWLRALHSEG